MGFPWRRRCMWRINSQTRFKGLPPFAVMAAYRRALENLARQAALRLRKRDGGDTAHVEYLLRVPARPLAGERNTGKRIEQAFCAFQTVSVGGTAKTNP